VSLSTFPASLNRPGAGRADADNVVLIGSPGVNAESVSDLQLPEDADVYASTAEHDIINNVYGADAALNAQGLPDIHGTPPVDDSFGAETFETKPGDEGSWPGGTSVDAHSQYWQPWNNSLDSMARIVAGKEPG